MMIGQRYLGIKLSKGMILEYEYSLEGLEN